MDKIKEGTQVTGSVIYTGKEVSGVLHYVGGKTVIVDEFGTKWLVRAGSVK